MEEGSFVSYAYDKAVIYIATACAMNKLLEYMFLWLQCNKLSVIYIQTPSGYANVYNIWKLLC